jgi:hypothetical protein
MPTHIVSTAIAGALEAIVGNEHRNADHSPSKEDRAFDVLLIIGLAAAGDEPAQEPGEEGRLMGRLSRSLRGKPSRD